MAVENETADQVVKMVLQGSEVVLRLTGEAAVRIATLIYNALKGDHTTAGRATLWEFLRSGKDQKVFQIPDEYLKAFTTASKKYGFPFVMLKDTGLKVNKNNKRKAEEMLQKKRLEFFVPQCINDLRSDMPFVDYLYAWLKVVKIRVKPTTYNSYVSIVERKIAPYFNARNLTLYDLKPSHIQAFYVHELESVSSNTVIHEHAVIYEALSLLLANNVPMKQIQEWLGHSVFSTTADIYSHLDYSAKVASSIALENGLPLPNRDFKTSWEG